MTKTYGLALLASCLLSASSLATDVGSFHFDKQPFINPPIIEDLSGWISDVRDQVISINLDESNRANRYFGSVIADRLPKRDSETPSRYPFVHIEDKDACGEPGKVETFGYELVGRVKDTYVLHTVIGGCGTGVFNNLLLVTIEPDDGFSFRDGKLLPKIRHVIRKICEIPVGDRYDGPIRIDGNKILIPRDRNEKDPAIAKDTVIELKRCGTKHSVAIRALSSLTEASTAGSV